MKKGEKKMIGFFTLPIVIVYLIIFLYPTVRTLYMSFFKMQNLSSPTDTWEFVGFQNYLDLFASPLFKQSFANIIKIGFLGGLAVFVIALYFAVTLSAKIRGRKLMRAILYLPNLITPVALVAMWTQYIFNNEYGLLHNFFNLIGLDAAASIPWTSPGMSFTSMMIAFCFGSVGYYMIIYMSAMEKIPVDFYDYAGMEGASRLQMFWKITMPLLKDTTKTAVTFWGIGAINFFLWSRVFSANPMDPNVIAPANYMFSMVFGGAGTGTTINVGGGCAVGVLLTCCVVIVFGILNLICGKESYEY